MKRIGAIAVGVAAFGLTVMVTTTGATGGGSSPVPSATAQQPVREFGIGEVKEIRTPSEISLPIDAFRPDPASENAILEAEYRLTQECMQGFGITFDQRVWSVPSQNHDYDRLFGVIKGDEVKKFGYHLPGEPPTESGLGNVNPNETPTNVSEADYMAVFMGDAKSLHGVAIPDGGCIGEARRTLGDDYALQSLIEDAVNFGLSQSNLDPRVVAAFAEWSTCMSQAGYTYAQPSEAINDPQWNTDSARATPQEVDVAVADVNCKRKTHLIGLRVAVAAAWQDEFIHDHATELKEATAGFATQVRTAKSVR